MKFIPYPYQEAAIQWILDRPASGLFLSMGMGLRQNARHAHGHR